MKAARKWFFWVIIGIMSSACFRPPYIQRGDVYPNPEPFADEPQFTRGEPNTIADGLGHYVFSLPSKLVLWNWKVDNHNISPETEESINTYLEYNDLKEVKVRLNEYAPFGEWHRLVHNRGVGAGWRYTVGVLLWAFYTVLPGRIFGGDNYNPYTNTISLYSDLPIIGLHEAGHAKDTAGDDHKGSYAILRILPFYALRDEYVASTDALTYVKSHDDLAMEKSAYKLLYPAYGTYVGGSLLNYIPGVRPLGAAIGAIPGHIVGRIKASKVPDPPENEKNEGAQEEE